MFFTKVKIVVILCVLNSMKFIGAMESICQESNEEQADQSDREVSQDAEETLSLHQAATLGSQKMVQLFLDQGADVNAKDSSGKTPLHWAARYDHEELVKWLLKNNADVNARANDNKTPLHSASLKGSKEIVELLTSPMK